MYRGTNIGVVVPAYNEEDLIAATLDGIPGYVDRIYVVDDASGDGTGDVIRGRQKSDHRILCLGHRENRGVGGAIATGYRAALSDGMEVIAVMAGDNQMDPGELSRLLDPVVEGKADYSKGNRLTGKESRRGMSGWRYLGNSILTVLTKIGSGYWELNDPQNGYTAVSRRVLERIVPEIIYPGYGYCNDLLVKMNVAGFRVVDIPMPARYGGEKSKIRYYRYIPRVSWLLLKGFCWRLRMMYGLSGFKPIVLFYFVGVILALVGLLDGLYSLLIIGRALFVRGALSFLMALVGSQSLLLGMLLEMHSYLKKRRL